MAGIVGNLINRARVGATQKAYIGWPHYSLLGGGLLDGSVVGSVVKGAADVVGAARTKGSAVFRPLGGKGVLTDLVTNAGVMRTQTLGGPASAGFAVKVGPGGTPGFYGIVPKTPVSTAVNSAFAVKVG